MIDDPDHGPLLDAADMSALLGVPAEQITAALQAQRLGTGEPERSVLPRAWIERGRSRADVYRSATGRDDMAGALEFWRAQRKEASQ
jgi:hypothetical protein